MNRSKTLPLYKNRADEGLFISTRATMEPVITNSVPVGAPSITDAFNGSTENNLSSAIEDLSLISVLPIGSVVINTTGESPQGSGQVTAITFDGTFIPEFTSSGKTHLVEILGIPTELTDKMIAGDIAKAFAKAAAEASAKNYIVSDSKPAEGQTVEITSTDSRTHVLPEFKVGLNCTVTASVVSPPKVGYGAWDLIGTVTQKFNNVVEPVELYYFKRIG